MPGEDAINWVSWPLRDEPWRKSALLIGAIVLAAAAAAIGFRAAFYGLLTLVLMPILLGPYFLPARFEVSDGGVKVFFPGFNRDRPWSVYKRYVARKDGVFLSPFAAPSRLDSFRGDFLRFGPAADREGVMALVRKHVAAP